MSRHDYFEELCAAASIGEASGVELAELHEHFGGCPECQRRYTEFLQLNANRYARNVPVQELSRDEAVGYIDSTLFRERFLRKAEAEGIVFSNCDVRADVPELQTRGVRSWNKPLWLTRAAAASALVALVMVSGYYLGSHDVPKSSIEAVKFGLAVDPGSTTDQEHAATIARLEAENRKLASEIETLRASLGSASSGLAQLQVSSASSEKDRSSLLADLEQREAAIADLQARLEQAQTAVTSVKADLEKMQSSHADNQAALVEERIRIRELSEELADKSRALERERELLAAGRDIRELMAARNLHIVDVFDTDPKGKTRPAFGRIFFTEGRSLIFYAYDLDDSRVKEAGYRYRIWGTKEGPSQRAKSLGIFYSDDKSQKRWVFQYDDPKVLDEIDSVFVTLEPPNGGPNQPKGEKLMYAYLRGQPNHP